MENINKVVNLNLRIEPELRDRIKKVGEATKRSQSNVARIAFDEYCTKIEKEQSKEV